MRSFRRGRHDRKTPKHGDLRDRGHQGSFRGAAQELGLAPSRISQSVSELEQALGVTLLYRTTRQLSLTNEAHILYAKESQMLEAAETGLDAINLISSQPTGELMSRNVGQVDRCAV